MEHKFVDLDIEFEKVYKIAMVFLFFINMTSDDFFSVIYSGIFNTLSSLLHDANTPISVINPNSLKRFFIFYKVLFIYNR